MKTVIFACVHNAGRSQMAAAFFNQLADPGAARALSAGTSPGARVHPEVVDVMREAGIAAPEPSLHDLRHSHASMLIALDVPLVDVQRRLGHRKPDTTLRVYAHQWKEREARRSQIGQQLGQLFGERKQLPAPPGETPLALPRASTAHH